MKTLSYTKAARRAWRRLPVEAQQRIEAALVRYAETGHGDVKTLSGAGGARLRAGDYRAIFIETEETIEVVAIGHRKDIYR